MFHTHCPYKHGGHVAGLVTEHLASHWSVFCTVNLAEAGTQITLLSLYLNDSC